MGNYKLDRTVFKMYHIKDATNNYRYWKTRSFEERLRAANYLNSVAYDFPLNNPHNLTEPVLKLE